MAFGLDATGFTKKRLDDLKTEINGLYESTFANTAILNAHSLSLKNPKALTNHRTPAIIPRSVKIG